MKTTDHPGGGGAILGTMPDGLMTRMEVARALGVSYDTVKRWDKDGKYSPKPENNVQRGGLTIYGYDDDDLEQMRSLVQTYEDRAVGDADAG